MFVTVVTTQLRESVLDISFFMRERPRVPSISTIWSPIVCVQIRFIDWLGLIRITQRRLFTGEKYLVNGKLFCSV